MDITAFSRPLAGGGHIPSQEPPPLWASGFSSVYLASRNGEAESWQPYAPV